MSSNITLKKESLDEAPPTIGVYQFIGKKDVLYIGKAVNIKARIASHLQNAKKDPKEAAIVRGAEKVKIIPTESEFKALLLEAELIKTYKPKYNKIWKDDKRVIEKSPLCVRINHSEGLYGIDVRIDNLWKNFMRY